MIDRSSAGDPDISSETGALYRMTNIVSAYDTTVAHATPHCPLMQTQKPIRAALFVGNPKNLVVFLGGIGSALRVAPVFNEWTWVALWKGHG
jgi:hypothetical protein